MDKKTFLLGVLAICISILMAAFIMKPQKERYTVVKDGDHLVIVDHETDKVYDKFLPENSGPTDWEEMKLP